MWMRMFGENNDIDVNTSKELSIMIMSGLIHGYMLCWFILAANEVWIMIISGTSHDKIAKNEHDSHDSDPHRCRFC
jgi:hypothetical protein